MKNPYTIIEKLTHQQLRDELKTLNKQYAGRRYTHKNGGTYEIYAVTTMNDNGASEWGFIYSPVNEGYADRNILHTRSLREFLDGRFIEVAVPLGVQLERLDLSVRAYHCLLNSGYSIEEVTKMDDDQLADLKYMNHTIFNEIREKIPYEGATQ